MKLTEPKTIEAVIQLLKRHRDLLAQAGVVHAGVFGSLATGKARDECDIDVLVFLKPDDNRTIYDLVAVERMVCNAVEGPVDVAIEDQLKPEIRERVLKKAVMAF